MNVNRCGSHRGVTDSARARKRRFSMKRLSRSYSSRPDSRTTRYSSAVLVFPRATSASPLRLLIGVRSSWARSAENCVRGANERSRRSSMESEGAREGRDLRRPMNRAHPRIEFFSGDPPEGSSYIRERLQAHFGNDEPECCGQDEARKQHGRHLSTSNPHYHCIVGPVEGDLDEPFAGFRLAQFDPLVPSRKTVRRGLSHPRPLLCSHQKWTTARKSL